MDNAGKGMKVLENDKSQNGKLRKNFERFDFFQRENL